MDPTLPGDTPLDTAPVLIIENPLDSYYNLSRGDLQLGSTAGPGLKFCEARLKHVESIDVIFTDDNQVSIRPLLLPTSSFISSLLQFVPSFSQGLFCRFP